MKNSILAVSLVAACMGTVGHSYATLIASDDFESYTTGSLNGLNGGSGFISAYTAQSPATVVAKTLSYANGSVVVNGGANAVQVAGSATDYPGMFYRQINTQNGNAIYMSFLFNISTPLTTVQEAFLQLGLGTAGNTEPSASAGVTGYNGSLTGPETFFARAGTGTTNTTQWLSGTNPVVKDTTYFMVVKISKSAGGASSLYNTVSLYLNPSSLDESSPTLQYTNNGSTTASSLSWLDLRAFRTDTNDYYYYDNLTIGTTMADVVPVPEVASIGLLGLGALALCRRRR